MKNLLLILLLLSAHIIRAQVNIPFEFVSEDENRLIKEDDSFKYYTATTDTTQVVCINEEGSWYRLLNKNHKVIAEGGFTVQNDKYYRDGKWTEYYGGGKVKADGYYSKDKQVGIWEEFYSNGKTKKIYNYGLIADNYETHSCLSGGYQEFYQSGSIKVNGFYAAVLGTRQDTVSIDDPVTGITVKKVITHTAVKSGKAGRWEYFSESGEVDKKEEY